MSLASWWHSRGLRSGDRNKVAASIKRLFEISPETCRDCILGVLRNEHADGAEQARPVVAALCTMNERRFAEDLLVEIYEAGDAKLKLVVLWHNQSSQFRRIAICCSKELSSFLRMVESTLMQGLVFNDTTILKEIEVRLQTLSADVTFLARGVFEEAVRLMEPSSNAFPGTYGDAVSSEVRKIARAAKATMLPREMDNGDYHWVMDECQVVAKRNPGWVTDSGEGLESLPGGRYLLVVATKLQCPESGKQVINRIYAFAIRDFSGVDSDPWRLFSLLCDRRKDLVFKCGDPCSMRGSVNAIVQDEVPVPVDMNDTQKAAIVASIEDELPGYLIADVDVDSLFA